MEPLYFSLLAAILISLVSLVGIVFANRHLPFSRYSLLAVSFAVGGLLGDAFIHIIPETYETINPTSASLLIILGISLFFVLEKILKWRHCHEPDHHTHHHHVPALNLVGDSFHNLIDGMLIAASFLVNPQLGLATTLAVVLHEIPQEIGDYGILLHHGYTPAKALSFNLISALFSLLGVLLTFIIGAQFSLFSVILLPVTAGGFIYLASSDLIPELHRHNPKVKDSLIQMVFIALGVGLMFLLTFLE